MTTQNAHKTHTHSTEKLTPLQDYNVHKKFFKTLVKKYCLADKKYIKRKQLIRELHACTIKYEQHEYKEFQEFLSDIVAILAVINFQNIDCDKYCIERYLQEDLGLQSELEKYFSISD